MKRYTRGLAQSVALGGVLASPGLALADDFHVNAPVRAAMVFADGGSLERSFTLDLPVGQHRIFLPFDMADFAQVPRIRADADIRVLGMTVSERLGVAPELVYSEEQRQAFVAVEAARARADALRDGIALRQAEIAGLQARIDFISSVGASSEADLSIAELAERADFVARNAQEARQAQDAIRQALREQKKALDEAEAETQRLEQAFDGLSPPQEDMASLALFVESPIAQTVRFEFEQQTYDIEWSLHYDVQLKTTGSEGNRLRIERNVMVFHDLDQPLIDIELSLSTGGLDSDASPISVSARRAWIREEREREMAVARSAPQMMEEPIIEPVIIEEEAGRPLLSVEGEMIGYEFAEPVTLVSGDAALLRLDEIGFAAREWIEAVPRQNETAFYKASFVNTSSEALLPGTAQFHRNGLRVGYGTLERVPAGAESEMYFGPANGIRLEFVQDRNETGDRGLLTTSFQRAQALSLRMENLTKEAQELRVLYGLPYSEQEDLVIDIESRPAPDAVNVEDQQGVAEWEMRLAAGEARSIDLDISLKWPQGWELTWFP